MSISKQAFRSNQIWNLVRCLKIVDVLCKRVKEAYPIGQARAFGPLSEIGAAPAYFCSE